MSELRKRGYLGEAGRTSSNYTSNLDSDQERLFNQIVLVAENDGAAYRKRDATMAFVRAKKEYIRNRNSDLDMDFRAIAPLVKQYLEDRWAQEQKDVRMNRR